MYIETGFNRILSLRVFLKGVIGVVKKFPFYNTVFVGFPCLPVFFSFTHYKKKDTY